MKLILKSSFISKLQKQTDFIALDSPKRAQEFRKKLIEALKEIPKFPLKNRKSLIFNDPNTREFIFKGYVIIYKIEHDQIIVFGARKQDISFK